MAAKVLRLTIGENKDECGLIGLHASLNAGISGSIR